MIVFRTFLLLAGAVLAGMCIVLGDTVGTVGSLIIVGINLIHLEARLRKS